MPKKHISKLAIILIVASCIYAASAYFITTSYKTIATITGLALILLMTVGFFYATLHLSKVK